MNFILWLVLSFPTVFATSPSRLTVSFRPSVLRRTCELRLGAHDPPVPAYWLSAHVPGRTSGWSPANFFFFLKTRAYRGSNGAATSVDGPDRPRLLDEHGLVLQAFARGRSPIHPDLGASAAELREKWSADDRALVDHALSVLRSHTSGTVFNVRWTVPARDFATHEVDGYLILPHGTAPRGLLLVPELDEAHRYMSEMSWKAGHRRVHSALLPVTVESVTP